MSLKGWGLKVCTWRSEVSLGPLEGEIKTNSPLLNPPVNWRSPSTSNIILLQCEYFILGPHLFSFHLLLRFVGAGMVFLQDQCFNCRLFNLSQCKLKSSQFLQNSIWRTRVIIIVENENVHWIEINIWWSYIEIASFMKRNLSSFITSIIIAHPRAAQLCL